jgi:hypothetical protein
LRDHFLAEKKALVGVHELALSDSRASLHAANVTWPLFQLQS